MSAKTNVVLINEALAVLTTDVATNTAAIAAIPGALTYGTVAYEGSITPHTSPNADLTAGKVTLFTNTTSAPGGNETYTDALFATPSDGDTYRFGHIGDPTVATNTITFNDGSINILILAPGEFVTMRYSSGLSQWFKITGV